MSPSEPDYQFEQRGRRPVVFLAAALSLIMIGVGIFHGAPWFFLAPVAAAALMTLIMLISNSRSGLVLDQSALRLFKDDWEECFSLADIAQVRAIDFSDGQPSVWLDLKDRPPYRIPGYCFGSFQTLKAALEARGVSVR